MNKQELKKLIKPLVKECIHEVLLEEGLLSNVVSEVAKGLQSNLIVENRQESRRENKKPNERLFKEDLQIKRKSEETRMKINNHRKSLLDAVGTGAYNGVDLFEGTSPISTAGKNNEQPSVLGTDPKDPGVDISSLIGNSTKVWKAIK
tara:strand:+ start:50890 stop:51333 length:444 start_codon:yes stop_codon:yes gene_type:complete